MNTWDTPIGMTNTVGGTTISFADKPSSWRYTKNTPCYWYDRQDTWKLMPMGRTWWPLPSRKMMWMLQNTEGVPKLEIIFGFFGMVPAWKLLGNYRWIQAPKVQMLLLNSMCLWRSLDHVPTVLNFRIEDWAHCWIFLPWCCCSSQSWPTGWFKHVLDDLRAILWSIACWSRKIWVPVMFGQQLSDSH